MKFTYSSGQRPLEGYTIKRGIGRGGFGEVYYGLSDGGKEVALKLVRGDLDVELRGMSQCLNFKHPNLVNLFDLRTDAQGDHWVVMEYVAGEPLNTILSRRPEGLAPELARQWFLGLAAAVGYLHDHGIVHRDLKPANIFLENGVVKVGDYGLSKFISSSRGSAQTQSVGTVHYMAPEISTGNYNKQIDIYSAGIILYEMLSGRVPFEGESVGEILMKHLTSLPDLNRVPAGYRPLLDKALRKNPGQRFASVAEMARLTATIGEEAIPIAEPARPARVESALRPDTAPRPVIVLDVPCPTPRGKVAELCGSLVMAALLAALLSILWTALGQTADWTEIGGCFFLTLSCSWAMLLGAKMWPKREEDSWGRRALMLMLGLAIGLVAAWLDGRSWKALLGHESFRPQVQSSWKFFGTGPGGSAQRSIPVVAGYMSYFGLAFFALRWWRMVKPNRSQRFGLFPLLAAGFWAYVLLFLWPFPEPPRGIVALVTTAAIVQLVSPWEQPPPPQAKRVRLRWA